MSQHACMNACTRADTHLNIHKQIIHYTFIHFFIHSFILNIYIAHFQEKLTTPARLKRTEKNRKGQVHEHTYKSAYVGLPSGSICCVLPHPVTTHLSPAGKSYLAKQTGLTYLLYTMSSER